MHHAGTWAVPMINHRISQCAVPQEQPAPNSSPLQLKGQLSDEADKKKCQRLLTAITSTFQATPVTPRGNITQLQQPHGTVRPGTAGNDWEKRAKPGQLHFCSIIPWNSMASYCQRSTCFCLLTFSGRSGLCSLLARPSSLHSPF